MYPRDVHRIKNRLCVPSVPQLVAPYAGISHSHEHQQMSQKKVELQNTQTYLEEKKTHESVLG